MTKPNPLYAVSEDELFRFHRGYENTPDGCSVWAGSLSAKGYGQLAIGGRMHAAHRVSYFLTHGTIDETLVIDHLCRNRACVNPDHLEQVTNHENILRGMAAGFGPGRPRATVCAKAGHPFTETNTITVPNGKRCRQCRNEYKRRKYAEHVSVA